MSGERRLRVVYVSTLDAGGPVSHLLELAPRVAESCDVRVVGQSEATAARFAATGLETLVVNVASKWDVRAVGTLRRALAGADVVHTQDRRAGLFGRAVGRAQGAAVVHTYHGLPEDIAPRVGREAGAASADAGAALPLARRMWLFGVYLPIERALAHLGAVVSPSQAMAAFLSSVGLPGRRIHVIPSGISVSRDEPPSRTGPLRIMTAANLEWWKGVDVLLEACAQLEEPYVLDVCGDGDARGELERRAARLGVHATFHGRVDDVAQRLAAAHLFVLPSRAENLPVSILEAMAVALPVVATRVGGIPELVDDPATGRVVPPDDPRAMAAAIAEFARDDFLRVSCGRAGAERARKHFDAHDVAGRLVDLYRELCASSK